MCIVQINVLICYTLQYIDTYSFTIVCTVEPPNNETFGTANFFIIKRFSLKKGFNIAYHETTN